MHKPVSLTACALLCLGGALPAGPVFAQDTPDAYYEDARQRFYEGDTDAALIQLKNALQLDADHMPSLVLAGEIYLAQRDYAAAEHAFSEALLFGADSRYVLPKLGETYVRQGDFTRLLREIPLDAVSGPERVSMLALHADAQMSLNRREVAEDLLRQAEQLDPNSPELLQVKVTYLLQTGAEEKALDTADQWLLITPDDSDAHRARGSVLHTLGRHSEALDAYDRALQLDQNNHEARLAKAGLLLDLGEDAEAEKELDYLAINQKDNPRAAYLRGMLLDRRGEHVAADAAMLQVVDIINAQPGDVIAADAQLTITAALANFSLKQYESAKNYLEAFLPTNPGHLAASRLLGAALIQLGQNAEAIQVLRNAMLDHPNDPGLQSLLATAYGKLGRYDEVVEVLGQLQRRNQLDERGLADLAFGRVRTGDVERGMRELAEAWRNDPEQETVGFTLAMTYLTAQRYDAAEEVATDLAERFPDNPINRNALGLIQYSRGDLEPAAENFDKVIAGHPEFLPARINRARVMLARGELQQARGELEHLSKDHPRDTAILLELARLERLSDNPEAAIAQATAALEVDPNMLDARRLLVETLLLQNSPEEALRVAREGVLTGSNTLRSLELLARAQLATGDTGGAQSTYNRMVREAEFLPLELNRIARLQMQAGGLTEAEHTLQKGLSELPGDPDLTLTLVELRLARKQPDRALVLSRDMARKFPRQAQWRRLEGVALAAQGNQPQAESAFRESLKLGHSTSAVLGLATALERQGKVEDAEQVLREANSEYPEDLALELALTEVLLRRGAWEEGRDRLQGLLEQAPEDPQLLNNMANVLQRLGDPAALDYARRAQAAAPEHPQINDTLGWLLVQDGRPEEGLRYLRQATTRLRGNATLHYHLAVALHQLGRNAEAASELDLALRAQGDYGWKEEALALRKTLKQGS